MKNLFTLGLSLAVMISSAFAQNDQLPANPKPGACYVKCVTPDVYKNETVRIMSKPAYKKMKVVPAEYKTVTERVLSKEASKKIVVVPATYKTVEVEYTEKEAANTMSVAPAVFGPSTETIETFPASAKWELGPPAPDCEGQDPDACRVWCYVNVPAQYETIETQVLKSDATPSKSPIALVKKTYKKQVIDQPATTKTVEIPAEYITIQKTVLVKDAYTTEETVPAEYKTVTKEVLQKKGGLTVWEEIECGLKNYNILPILYELGSARLTPASKTIVEEKILKLMQEKPLIKVEIASHTDARGSATNNQRLSESRAQSVVNYLVGKGINPSRLSAKGYGESRLLNRCADGVNCSEKEHQRNRRTEFRVVGE